MESHGGGLASEYVIGEGEVKVEGEKIKEKSWPILATGGTCELMGKEIPGAACDTGTKRAKNAQAFRREAIFGGSTNSVCREPNLKWPRC